MVLLVAFGSNFPKYQEDPGLCLHLHMVWNTCGQELTFLEFFAGQGHVWKHMRADSIGTIGIDVLYWDSDTHDPRAEPHKNPFDILTDSGLSLDPQK